MRKEVSLGILLAIALISIDATAFAQSCPMCKESMTSAGAKLSGGFYQSILAMFFPPFLIVGGIGTIVFKSWFDRKHPGQHLSTLSAVKVFWNERKNK